MSDYARPYDKPAYRFPLVVDVQADSEADAQRIMRRFVNLHTIRADDLNVGQVGYTLMDVNSRIVGLGCYAGNVRTVVEPPSTEEVPPLDQLAAAAGIDRRSLVVTRGQLPLFPKVR